MSKSRLPDPTPEAVALWMKHLTRTQLHDSGWRDANKHLHGITRTARQFIHAEFPLDEQEAAFDGMTLALVTLMRFADIDELATQLKEWRMLDDSAALQGTKSIASDTPTDTTSA